MMVFLHFLAVLYETFSVTRIITDGYVKGDSLHALHARQIFDSSGFLPVGTNVKPLIYAAPVENEEAFHIWIFLCLSDYPQLPRHL
jgi:hypothetical protein